MDSLGLTTSVADWLEANPYVLAEMNSKISALGVQCPRLTDVWLFLLDLTRGG